MSTAFDKALAKAKEGKLAIKIGDRIIKNEEHVPKADLSASTSGPYLALALDPDAPFPSFHPLGPILHWMQSDLTPVPADGAPTTTLSSTTRPITNYIGAGPPPISGPHRYVFLLFKQPEGFDFKAHAMPEGKETPVSKRMRWDLEGFGKKVGLEEAVAGGLFVSN